MCGFVEGIDPKGRRGLILRMKGFERRMKRHFLQGLSEFDLEGGFDEEQTELSL